jgi:cob(I)alamin adenosyltransferase
MLYTGKGDGGTTKIFGCDQQRISKSSAVIEALGALDELNSWIGFCRAKNAGLKTLERVQQNLFIIQAEVAGAPGKTIIKTKVSALGREVNAIEKKLPPIKSFFLPGATLLGGALDYARTLARRAERAVVRAREENPKLIGPFSLAYLNRLSSLLYALARLANHKSGIKETPPTYE